MPILLIYQARKNSTNPFLTLHICNRLWKTALRTFLRSKCFGQNPPNSRFRLDDMKFEPQPVYFQREYIRHDRLFENVKFSRNPALVMYSEIAYFSLVRDSSWKKNQTLLLSIRQRVNVTENVFSMRVMVIIITRNRS